MRFKPTFVVTVIPGQLAQGDTVKGQPFASVKDATIVRPGRPDCTRTVMAFGPAAAILAKARPGVPMLLSVRHDEARLRVVGEAQAA